MVALEDLTYMAWNTEKLNACLGRFGRPNALEIGIFNGFSMVITDEDVKIWLGLWSMHSDNAYSLYIAYSYIPVFFGGWLARWEFLAE